MRTGMFGRGRLTFIVRLEPPPVIARSGASVSFVA